MTKKTFRGAAVCAVISLGAVACGSGPVEEAGQTDESIIGGSLDAVHTSVGIIEFEIVEKDGTKTTELCTGSLIAPNAVLTAGHCVSPTALGAVSASNWRVYFGAIVSQAKDSDWIPVSQTYADPEYDPSQIADQKDLAVLVLSRSVSLKPMPVNFTALGKTVIGRAVTTVGYGVTNVAADGSYSGQAKQRNAITTPITELDTNTLVVGRNGKTTCGGDSGGPTIMRINGVDTIIAATSWGMTKCNAGGHVARTDTASDFLSQFIEAASSPPPPPTPPPAPSPSPGPGGGGGTSQSGYQCCLDSTCYVCPDQASYDKCAGFDISACFAACTTFTCYSQCSQKAAAATHDPSGCTAQ